MRNTDFCLYFVLSQRNLAHVIRGLNSRVSLQNNSGLTFGTDHAGYPYAYGILTETLEALLQDLVEERLQPLPQNL